MVMASILPNVLRSKKKYNGLSSSMMGTSPVLGVKALAPSVGQLPAQPQPPSTPEPIFHPTDQAQTSTPGQLQPMKPRLPMTEEDYLKLQPNLDTYKFDQYDVEDPRTKQTLENRLKWAERSLQINPGNAQIMGEINELKNQLFGVNARNQISSYGKQYQTDAQKFRDSLTSSLSNTGQKFFQQMNPYILEDLNARGLASSESAVSREQADALKEIELENQRSLTNFDTGAFNTQQNINSDALSALLQGNQSGLDAALNFDAADLNRRYALEDADREQRLAEMLAKKKKKGDLTSSLLRLGGTAIGAYFGGPYGAAIGSKAGDLATRD